MSASASTVAQLAVLGADRTPRPMTGQLLALASLYCPGPDDVHVHIMSPFACSFSPLDRLRVA